MKEKFKDILVGCTVAVVCLTVGALTGTYAERRVQTLKREVLQERIDTLSNHNDILARDLDERSRAYETAQAEADSLAAALKKSDKVLKVYTYWNKELCLTLRAITGDSRIADQYEATVIQYELSHTPTDED